MPEATTLAVGTVVIAGDPQVLLAITEMGARIVLVQVVLAHKIQATEVTHTAAIAQRTVDLVTSDGHMAAVQIIVQGLIPAENLIQTVGHIMTAGQVHEVIRMARADQEHVPVHTTAANQGQEPVHTTAANQGQELVHTAAVEQELAQTHTVVASQAQDQVDIIAQIADHPDLAILRTDQVVRDHTTEPILEGHLLTEVIDAQVVQLTEDPDHQVVQRAEARAIIDQLQQTGRVLEAAGIFRQPSRATVDTHHVYMASGNLLCQRHILITSPRHLKISKAGSISKCAPSQV